MAPGLSGKKPLHLLENRRVNNGLVRARIGTIAVRDFTKVGSVFQEME